MEGKPSADSPTKSSGPAKPAVRLKLQPRSADKSHMPQASAHIEVLPGARPAQHLHICRCCDSELIQASEWEDAGDDHWQLRLRCPNCGWCRRGTFSSIQLAALEDHLDVGFNVLLRDLKRFTAANMTEEIERFALALETELILPEDF